MRQVSRIQKKNKLFNNCLLKGIVTNLGGSFSLRQSLSFPYLSSSTIFSEGNVAYPQIFLFFVMKRLAHIHNAECSKKNQFVNTKSSTILESSPKKSFNNQRADNNLHGWQNFHVPSKEIS